MFSRNLTRPLAVAVAAMALGGGAYGIVNATAGNGSGSTTAATSAGAAPSSGSNARSGPAAGGAAGTVGSVSTSGHTIATSAGQRVSVERTSSTTYRKGQRSIPASSVKKGQSVLVLGTVNGATITATHVIVNAAGGAGSATSSATKVVPFQHGAPATSKQVGQIPVTYTQGSGTIVSGTQANKATETALAAYPGGIVDRVVKLSNGEYEVHNIGVNWPHHIFVNQDFKVVGAD